MIVEFKLSPTEESFLEISEEGEVIKFDNKLCREIAKGDINNAGVVFARTMLAMLDFAAKQVDNVYSHCGEEWIDPSRTNTYGYRIRNLEKKKKESTVD